MKNNIYEMINNKDFDFDNYERLEFDDIEKRKIKNNLSKSIKVPRKKHKKSISSIACLIILSVLFFNTDIGVQAFGAIKGSIDRILKTQESLEEYKTVLDGSVVDKGIEIKVSEVILDEEELYIFNQIRSNKKISEEENYGTSIDIYINDKKVGFSNEGGESKNIDDYTTENLDSYNLYWLEGIDLSGDINIKIVYTEAGIYPDYTEGRWEFDFVTNREALKNKTRTGDVNYKFNVGNGGEITLDSYRINPLGMNIYGKWENEDHSEPYIVRLRGSDNLGNKVTFGLGGGGDHIELGSKPLNPEAKYIKLTPCAMRFPRQNEKPEEEVKVGEEFVIYLK